MAKIVLMQHGEARVPDSLAPVTAVRAPYNWSVPPEIGKRPQQKRPGLGVAAGFAQVRYVTFIAPNGGCYQAVTPVG